MVPPRVGSVFLTSVKNQDDPPDDTPTNQYVLGNSLLSRPGQVILSSWKLKLIVVASYLGKFKWFVGRTCRFYGCLMHTLLLYWMWLCCSVVVPSLSGSHPSRTSNLLFPPGLWCSLESPLSFSDYKLTSKFQVSPVVRNWTWGKEHSEDQTVVMTSFGFVHVCCYCSKFF